MFSLSVLNWRRRDAAIESNYDGEKKPRKTSKILQMVKSCFGYGSIEVDVPSRKEYQRANDPATGFKGDEVCGFQAEYLDEDDMAWGKPKKSKKQVRRNDGSFAR